MPDITVASAVPVWLLTLLQAVEKLLIIFVLVGVVCLIIKGLATFIRLYFYRHGYDLKMVENEEYVDVNERIRPGVRRRVKRFLVPQDERIRVRHRYKKEVEALRRSGYVLKRDQTPRERAMEVGDYNFEKLTEKYENLRYTEE
jgi:hypothetical protein